MNTREERVYSLDEFPDAINEVLRGWQGISVNYYHEPRCKGGKRNCVFLVVTIARDEIKELMFRDYDDGDLRVVIGLKYGKYIVFESCKPHKLMSFCAEYGKAKSRCLDEYYELELERVIMDEKNLVIKLFVFEKNKEEKKEVVEP